MTAPALWLLRQTDGSPGRRVDRRTIERLGDGLLQHLLAEGVLRELPFPDMAPPCRDCDEDCWRPLVHEDQTYYALCPLGRAQPERIDRSELETYEVVPEALCAAIRHDTGLGGEPVERIAAGLWLLGRADDDRTVLLLLGDAPAQPASLAPLVQSVADPAGAILLLARHDGIAHSARVAMVPSGAQVLELVRLLELNPARPLFRLTLPAAAGADAGVVEPALVLARETRTVTYHGTRVPMSGRCFELLELLAEEALDGDGFVSRDTIQDALFAAGEDHRAADTLIKRLRQAFKQAMGPAFDANALIQSRPKAGWRLALSSDRILLS